MQNGVMRTSVSVESTPDDMEKPPMSGYIDCLCISECSKEFKEGKCLKIAIRVIWSEKTEAKETETFAG